MAWITPNSILEVYRDGCRRHMGTEVDQDPPEVTKVTKSDR